VEVAQMKVDELLALFKEHRRKKLFTLSDIITLADERRSSVSVQLSRMAKARIVENPLKGIYLNPFNIPSVAEIAMFLRDPCYLSMEYALSRSGILSQEAFTLTLVTTRPPHRFVSPKNVFEYHQVKQDLFWGYRKDGNVLVADPEKALLDLIYLRYTRSRVRDERGILSLMDDMYLEDLDRDRLMEYGKRFDQITLDILSKGMVIK
jgi:predicted transcriptional regulator of viral defense system